MVIFVDMGFLVVEGLQIESDWYNFDVLNIFGYYLVCVEMDMFYMKQVEGVNMLLLVLCIYISFVQICVLEVQGVLICVIVLGCVYCVDYDQMYMLMFNQIEGLCIDKDISMVNLKWVLEEFLLVFFGKCVKI